MGTLATFGFADLGDELRFVSKVPGVPSLGELGFPCLGTCWLEMLGLQGPMVGELGAETLGTLANFGFAGLGFEFEVCSKVRGIPRLGALGCPSLGVAGLHMVVADLMDEMVPREVALSFLLWVDRLGGIRVESGATVGAPSISPSLGSNLGGPRSVH